ncbi:hypothetical protein PHET_06118 [Paragonimus heterotremus]|uniref:ISXO2-like transposase domain-containing protein n=1 Tax=Paragonimus heterotremus TaxID=100268 RepID=A0A8J4SP08_9TREM|nr:hypothetical protein PHET_06118 [Paragonimus heterotremus]
MKVQKRSRAHSIPNGNVLKTISEPLLLDSSDDLAHPDDFGVNSPAPFSSVDDQYVPPRGLFPSSTDRISHFTRPVGLQLRHQSARLRYAQNELDRLDSPQDEFVVIDPACIRSDDSFVQPGSSVCLGTPISSKSRRTSPPLRKCGHTIERFVDRSPYPTLEVEHATDTSIAPLRTKISIPHPDHLSLHDLHPTCQPDMSASKGHTSVHEKRTSHLPKKQKRHIPNHEFAVFRDGTDEELNRSTSITANPRHPTLIQRNRRRQPTAGPPVHLEESVEIPTEVTINDNAGAKPERTVTAKTIRRREAFSRMSKRLLCGVVEMPLGTDQNAVSIEGGNRTNAQAICSQVFSCRDDWLNEPGLRLVDFYHLVNDDIRLLCWLARRRLIPNRMQCNKVDCDAKLFLVPDSGNLDGWVWRCDKCRNTRSIRHRSIFTHCDMPIKTATKILYLWSIGHPRELIPYDTDSSAQDANDWLYCIREVCRETNADLKERIGGVEGVAEEPGYCRVVEVDESLFSCWVHDPQLGPTMRKVWLLGGVERGTERTFLARCPQNSRDAFSLIPVIREFVKPGTAIITDEWEGYAPLNQLPEGYQHYITDRTKGILCPQQNAVHIQKITGQWSHWKRNFESLNGIRSDEFETRLDEFLWRMRHSKAILQSFNYSVTLLFEV